MITLITSGKKSGLRDWVLQRFTGLFISCYFLFIVVYLFYIDDFTYQNWSILFNSFIFKIFTMLFMFSVVLHSSIGMGIILTDYIKQTYIRIILDFTINIILLSYVFSIMQILWGLK